MTTEMFTKIEKCRVCGNKDLVKVFDLGTQYLSGFFPDYPNPELYSGPLTLVKCDETHEGGCGHVQLQHTFDLSTMYGENYGYRSGLNSSMVEHLRNKADRIRNQIDLNDGDIVLDIAGNDGTFLGFFPMNLRRINIDPTSEKFSEHIPTGVEYAPEFFSTYNYIDIFGTQKAKVVTSFSMFYDLDDPCAFAKEVRQILDDDGIWVLEQSYMPEMLRQNSFDTICHEHLSYYGMRQLKYIMDQSGFKIIDIEFNSVNGGSVSITVAPVLSSRQECVEEINEIIAQELEEGLDTVAPWHDFEERRDIGSVQIWRILNEWIDEGLKIAGLGASTKGNVTLQTWTIDNRYIKVIGDVNPDKHGCYTPGTWIPIEDEDFVLEEYDAFVVLPWHFKEFFINNPKFKGKKLLFPLPTPEVVIP